MPSTQPRPPPHLAPHLPQFLLSLWVSTQTLPQSELPEGHAVPHCPSEQVGVPPEPSGLVQTLLHAPQFFRSLRGSMHAAPQAMYGLWH